MSVTDILRKQGKWKETKELIDIVSEDLNIGDRQAYRRIKQAWKDKEIKKVVLPDRSVLYGLPEFGPISTAPSEKTTETLSFQDAFKYRCFKRLEEISSLSLLKPVSAFLLLGNLTAMLPSPQRERLEPTYKEARKIVAEIQKKDISLSALASQNQVRVMVRHLIGEISKVLHES